MYETEKDVNSERPRAMCPNKPSGLAARGGLVRFGAAAASASATFACELRTEIRVTQMDSSSNSPKESLAWRLARDAFHQQRSASFHASRSTIISSSELHLGSRSTRESRDCSLRRTSSKSKTEPDESTSLFSRKSSCPCEPPPPTARASESSCLTASRW